MLWASAMTQRDQAVHSGDADCRFIYVSRGQDISFNILSSSWIVY